MNLSDLPRRPARKVTAQRPPARSGEGAIPVLWIRRHLTLLQDEAAASDAEAAKLEAAAIRLRGIAESNRRAIVVAHDMLKAHSVELDNDERP